MINYLIRTVYIPKHPDSTIDTQHSSIFLSFHLLIGETGGDCEDKIINNKNNHSRPAWLIDCNVRNSRERIDFEKLTMSGSGVVINGFLTDWKVWSERAECPLLSQSARHLSWLTLLTPPSSPDEAQPLPILEVSRATAPLDPSGTEVVRPALVARQDRTGGGDADSPLPGSVGDISGDSAPLDSSVTGLGTLGPGWVLLGGLQVEHDQQGEMLKYL